MNILFLTFGTLDMRQKGLYQDLLHALAEQGNRVFAVCPRERRTNAPTQCENLGAIKILHVRMLNAKGKVSLLEKGLSLISAQHQYIKAIRNHFSQIHFDLLLYSTPPITFGKIVSWLKRRDQAHTFLLLKDIFPQNAVDLNMMKENGLIHRYFRKQEKKLYALSDRIGTMSKANSSYLLKHNPEIATEKVMVCSNSIIPLPKESFVCDRAVIRKQYGIPQDATVFLYGGSLGIPQGLDFFIAALQALQDRADLFFLIVGDGTHKEQLEKAIQQHNITNARLLSQVPKADYDKIMMQSDAGLIFLDKRFTIPNFPSRLTAYFEAGLPVISATDAATDIGQVILEANAGCATLSGDLEAFILAVSQLASDRSQRQQMGENGRRYLEKHYDAHDAAKTITTFESINLLKEDG